MGISQKNDFQEFQAIEQIDFEWLSSLHNDHEALQKAATKKRSL